MTHRFRILVIDDEPEALELLKLTLSMEGFDVVVAQGALAGLRAAYQVHPDAILLDVMMPDVDGFETCRRLRELTEVPIIFVTAMGTMKDIVRGFHVGGDDYVVKPFDRNELLARIQSSLRRAGDRSHDGSAVMFPTESVMLNCDRHELVIGDKIVYLTPKEFEILRYLIQHTGKVLSTDAILSRVWGSDQIGEAHLIKQYIYRLRLKIEDDPTAPQHIQTVRGGGYYFDAGNLL